MATFRRKPEIVDARQFTGAKENAVELSNWVMAHAGDEVRTYVSTDIVKRERIKLFFIKYLNSHETAYEGEWVMLHQDGFFSVVTQKELDDNYEQV